MTSIKCPALQFKVLGFSICFLTKLVRPIFFANFKRTYGMCWGLGALTENNVTKNAYIRKRSYYDPQRVSNRFSDYIHQQLNDLIAIGSQKKSL